MKLPVSILSCLLLSSISGVAASADQIFVNKHGNLIIRLDAHNSYRSLSLYSTGNPNQIAYDLSIGGAEPKWGYLNNVTRNVVVRSRSGVDSFYFDNLQLPGNLTVISGGGDDNVVLNETTVSGNLVVKAGGHNDYVELIDSTVFGKTVVNTGGGHDDVLLNGSSLEGKVNVLLGRGWDDLSVSDSSFTYYSPVFNGQQQVDTYTDDGTNNFLGGDPVISYFEKKNIETAPPAFVTVANVVSLSLQDAETALSPLEVSVTEVNSDMVAAGVVISQNLLVGSEVAENTVVELIVSLGPQTFQIGDIGPGGGVVFALLNDEGTSGLEYAPAVFFNQTWGCLGVDVDPDNINTDDGIDVAPGVVSSALLQTANSNGTCESPIATDVSAYIGPNGETDWYIPSTDELIAIRDSNVPNVFLPGIPGDAYWSSTEDSQGDAFLVFIRDPGNDLSIVPVTSNKNAPANLLPIRTF